MTLLYLKQFQHFLNMNWSLFRLCNHLVPLVILLILLVIWLLKRQLFEVCRQRRRDRYHEYLKSDAWQRKRHVVFKRDGWRCVHCGRRATQVHHKKYAKYNIGKEPIEWLESVCENCHQALHR